jgi:hypothetical protein
MPPTGILLRQCEAKIIEPNGRVISSWLVGGVVSFLGSCLSAFPQSTYSQSFNPWLKSAFQQAMPPPRACLEAPNCTVVAAVVLCR